MKLVLILIEDRISISKSKVENSNYKLLKLFKLTESKDIFALMRGFFCMF